MRHVEPHWTLSQILSVRWQLTQDGEVGNRLIVAKYIWSNGSSFPVMGKETEQFITDKMSSVKKIKHFLMEQD